MSKADMIETIQKEERKKWDSLKKAEKLFGKKDKLTIKRRAVWSAIYNLMESMSIKGLDAADTADLAKLDAE